MKTQLIILVTLLFTAMITSCTPEAILENSDTQEVCCDEDGEALPPPPPPSTGG